METRIGSVSNVYGSIIKRARFERGNYGRTIFYKFSMKISMKMS